MDSHVRRTLASLAVLWTIAACGGPKQYVQQERPPQSACEPGTQPAVVGLSAHDSTNIWSCLPACPRKQEYVSQLRTSQSFPSIEPKCERICPEGWERKFYIAPALTMNDVMADVCTANQRTDCQPVSDEAKADYERDHEQCEGGRRIAAEAKRAANPQAACMHDCRDKAGKCTVECRNGNRALLPGCMSACQVTTDACTSKCPYATADDTADMRHVQPTADEAHARAEKERALERERFQREQDEAKRAAAIRDCNVRCDQQGGTCSARCGSDEGTCRDLCLPGPKWVSCKDACHERASKCSQSCIDGVGPCKESCK